MLKFLILSGSHLFVAMIGFAGGIYVLPILTASPSSSVSEIKAVADQAEFEAQFRRDLKGSDFLHWGEGTVSVSASSIALMGRISPGPDYKLYLSPEFVETEAEFLELKSQMALVGDVKTFRNFIVPVPEGIDPRAYTTVVIWCEVFNEFITAAKYRFWEKEGGDTAAPPESSEGL